MRWRKRVAWRRPWRSIGWPGKADRKRRGSAIGLYRRALREQPHDPNLRYELGLALALQGRWEAAIEQYTQTLRFSPNNAEAHYNLGYAFRRQGRLEEAATHFQEALRLKPTFPLAQYNLGCVLADT